jgi:hypothetical protein
LGFIGAAAEATSDRDSTVTTVLKTSLFKIRPMRKFLSLQVNTANGGASQSVVTV